MIRIIIAGSRDLYNHEIFNSVISPLFANIPTEEMEIISGGCRGADAMGEKYAKNHGIKCTVFPADWNKYGKSAGAIRNEQMAKYASEADNGGILVAFPMGESRGTRNMIKLAKQYGLVVYVHES